MLTVRKIEQVRREVEKARAGGMSTGFVPTMGALHEGHVSLIRAARRECDYVVVSIFVNPTQFGPGEDLDEYPRKLEADEKLCAAEGVDLIFAPAVNEMYPRENLTWVDVDRLSENLCGRSRGGHFRGVATVCTKLFNIVAPDKAFFGQKDAQQAAVIRRMVSDLNMRLDIVVCPTVREDDGLAVSSRNAYLSETERGEAVRLYNALCRGREMIGAGERDCGKLTAEMRGVIEGSELCEVEYLQIVDAETLEDVERIEGAVIAATAVRLGKTRLIDNMLIDGDMQVVI